uniref:Uncharacterized protein n=1 Tax=Anguilla anguilla TaxID=7936 RepID=A0A0E9PKD8_ANGAN
MGTELGLQPKAYMFDNPGKTLPLYPLSKVLNLKLIQYAVTIWCRPDCNREKDMGHEWGMSNGNDTADQRVTPVRICLSKTN